MAKVHEEIKGMVYRNNGGHIMMRIEHSNGNTRGSNYTVPVRKLGKGIIFDWSRAKGVLKYLGLGDLSQIVRSSERLKDLIDEASETEDYREAYKIDIPSGLVSKMGIRSFATRKGGRSCQCVNHYGSGII